MRDNHIKGKLEQKKKQQAHKKWKQFGVSYETQDQIVEQIDILFLSHYVCEFWFIYQFIIVLYDKV
jgi:hypothetical protein